MSILKELEADFRRSSFLFISLFAEQDFICVVGSSGETTHHSLSYISLWFEECISFD